MCNLIVIFVELCYSYCMDFPILSLINDERAEEWLLNYFHPKGLFCPHCEASVEEARHFRTTIKSGLKVYRCKKCSGVYNLYSGTVFAHKRFRPAQVVLILHGISRGSTTSKLARELNMSRQTVHYIRQALQSSDQMLQPEDGLPDTESENR